MPATVETYFLYGVGPSAQSATNVRFKLADNNVQDDNDPSITPIAGVNYSRWKVLVLYASVAPDTGINNIKLYTDGNLPWAGCTLSIGYITGPIYGTDTYRQATQTGNSGDEMVANYAELSGSTDMFSFTSDSPAAIPGSIGAATGEISDYIVLQLTLTTSVLGGTQAAETLTWRFDET